MPEFRLWELLFPETIGASVLPHANPRTTDVVPVPAAELVAPTPALPDDRNPAAVYLASLAASGRRTQLRALNNVAELLSGGAMDAQTLPWWQLEYQHLQALRTHMVEDGYAPATINKHLSAVRRVLEDAWRLGLIDGEQRARVTDVKRVTDQRLPAGRSLEPGEVQALFRACAEDERPNGVRDAALFALLYGGGLRRSELVALDLEDYDRDTGALVVHGKGRKERFVYATNGGRDALEAWIEVRGTEPGPLLLPVDKGGNVHHRRLTDQAILYVCRRRAADAGVKAFTPHDLRRTFVGDLLDGGADLAMVQRLAGHAQPTTTSRYDRRPEAKAKQANSLLHVPYTARSRPSRDGRSQA